jgi:hypothetical protein
MLKGKSTIELFDGVTGKKKEEYKDENILTGAINNLLDFNNEMLAGGVAVNSMLERLTPIYPHYIRGVLLWDDIINENAGHILPPPGSNCVGHAGGIYGGANPLRGTLNMNETVLTQNGVRMVWDFATDKANSSIKSISLTSIAGGDRGWMTPWEDGTFFRQRINSGNINQTIVNFAPSITATAMPGIPITYAGELRRGIHTYVADRNDSALTIIEQTYADPSKISIFDSAGLLTQNPPHCKETLFSVASDARFVNLPSNFIIDGNNNLVHVALTGSGNRTARIRTVNLITKTIVSDRVVTLDREVVATSAAFFKNKLYATVVGQGISEFSEEGRFRELVMNFIPSLRYICFGGDYLAGPFNSMSGGGMLLTDGIKTLITQAGSDLMSAMNLANSTSLKPPLYTMVNEGGSTHPKFVGYVTPYMATINNLSMTVGKDNQNTMKVTYELAQN